MPASISESWTRIVAWLRTNAPGQLEHFQPPATDEELEAAASNLGLQLPEDIKEFYRIVNGADPESDSTGIFPPPDRWDMAFGPLTLETVVQEWEMQKELLESGDYEGLNAEPSQGVAKDWWNLGWIPFADNGGGDFYCIDMAPTDAGTSGQVISHSHESGERKLLATSLGEYLKTLADALEADECDFDDDYGVRLKEEDE